MDNYYERLNQAFANWNGGEPSLEQRVEDLEAEMLQKQDILTFDTEPIENSENPVTSGGLFSQFERYVIYGSGTQIQQNSDIDTYTTRGTFYCNSADVASISGKPSDLTNAFRLDVFVLPAGRRQQRIFPVGSVPVFYLRNSLSSGWGAWYKFSGTVVT